MTPALLVIPFGLAVCLAVGVTFRWLARRCPRWLADWLARKRWRRCK